jgi:aryl-alcohol dehydrogenase-like predicted oxidoreductase
MAPRALLAACAAAALAGAQTVPKRKLGASSVDVSSIILGTLHLHEAGDAAGALQKLQAAVALGITTIDTSDVYNQMPELLGAALQLQPGLREQVQVRVRGGRCAARVTGGTLLRTGM